MFREKLEILRKHELERKAIQFYEKEKSLELDDDDFERCIFRSGKYVSFEWKFCLIYSQIHHPTQQDRDSRKNVSWKR